MKTIKIGSMISQKNGNKFGITKIIDDKFFFGIWVGNKSFTDKTTFNGFIRNGDFRCDNILFKTTKNGFKRVGSIGGILGLMKSTNSQDMLDMLDA